MKWFELTNNNLESKLADFQFREEDIVKIAQDISFYDKYYAVENDGNIGFIKIWTQPFQDPYMRIDVDECDLTSFKGQLIPIKNYIDILDHLFKRPQIVRSSEADLPEFLKRGFHTIDDKDTKLKTIHPSSILINIIKYINKSAGFFKDPRIRLMLEDDVPKIIELFKQEYPARFRAVPVLYEYDKTSCFVYDDGVIKGVMFSELNDDHLYVHQILVGEKFRGKNITEGLLLTAQNHALLNKKQIIRGTIRGNLLRYYARMGVEENVELPRSCYLARFWRL